MGQVLNYTALSKAQILFNQILFVFILNIVAKPDLTVATRKLIVLFQQSLHMSSTQGISRKKGQESQFNETLVEGIVFFLDQFVLRYLSSSTLHALDALVNSEDKYKILKVGSSVKSFLTDYLRAWDFLMIKVAQSP